MNSIIEEDVRQLLLRNDNDYNYQEANKRSFKNQINHQKRKNKTKVNEDETTKESNKCTLLKRRSPTPKLSDLLQRRISKNENNKNFLFTNIQSVKNKSSVQRFPIMQDTCNGHCQNIEQAGLLPKYVFKKEYGKVPIYIRRNRKIEKDNKMKEKLDESLLKPAWIKVNEEEKQSVLKGLKQNLAELERQLITFPMIVDTLCKRRKKISLEQQITKLQNDIEMLQNNDIVIVND